MNHRIDFSQLEKLEEAAGVYGVTKSEITRASLDKYLTSLRFMQNDPAVKDYQVTLYEHSVEE